MKSGGFWDPDDLAHDGALVLFLAAFAQVTDGSLGSGQLLGYGLSLLVTSLVVFLYRTRRR